MVAVIAVLVVYGVLGLCSDFWSGLASAPLLWSSGFCFCDLCARGVQWRYLYKMRCLLRHFDLRTPWHAPLLSPPLHLILSSHLSAAFWSRADFWGASCHGHCPTLADYASGVGDRKSGLSPRLALICWGPLSSLAKANYHQQALQASQGSSRCQYGTTSSISPGSITTGVWMVLVLCQH